MLKNYYLPIAIAWTVIITYLSLADVGSISNSIKIPYKDKMIHFVFYFLFYFFWYLNIKNKNNNNQKLNLILVAISYGVLMEILQYYMNMHRSADVYDILANSIGAILAYVFIKNANYFNK